MIGGPQQDYRVFREFRLQKSTAVFAFFKRSTRKRNCQFWNLNHEPVERNGQLKQKFQLTGESHPIISTLKHNCFHSLCFNVSVFWYRQLLTEILCFKRSKFRPKIEAQLRRRQWTPFETSSPTSMRQIHRSTIIERAPPLVTTAVWIQVHSKVRTFIKKSCLFYFFY